MKIHIIGGPGSGKSFLAEKNHRGHKEELYDENKPFPFHIAAAPAASGGRLRKRRRAGRLHAGRGKRCRAALSGAGGAVCVQSPPVFSAAGELLPSGVVGFALSSVRRAQSRGGHLRVRQSGDL